MDLVCSATDKNWSRLLQNGFRDCVCLVSDENWKKTFTKWFHGSCVFISKNCSASLRDELTILKRYTSCLKNKEDSWFERYTLMDSISF